MPLANYSTTVPADRLIDEITKDLRSHGATAIVMTYDQAKGPGTLDALISALAVHRFHIWPDREAPTR